MCVGSDYHKTKFYKMSRINFANEEGRLQDIRERGSFSNPTWNTITGQRKILERLVNLKAQLRPVSSPIFLRLFSEIILISRKLFKLERKTYKLYNMNDISISQRCQNFQRSCSCIKHCRHAYYPDFYILLERNDPDKYLKIAFASYHSKGQYWYFQKSNFKNVTFLDDSSFSIHRK